MVINQFQEKASGELHQIINLEKNRERTVKDILLKPPEAEFGWWTQ